MLLFVGSYGENTTIFACVSHLSLWKELPPNLNDLNMYYLVSTGQESGPS